MDLIIGGQYQGKLAYARQAFGIADSEIFCCTEDGEPDFSRRCIAGLERYLRACRRDGRAPGLERLREDAVVICTDIFCGLVPMNEEERAWREFAGRTVTGLAAQAETVTRIFCGLPQRLKG